MKAAIELGDKKAGEDEIHPGLFARITFAVLAALRSEHAQKSGSE